jgi:hypothetical protein
VHAVGAQFLRWNEATAAFDVLACVLTFDAPTSCLLFSAYVLDCSLPFHRLQRRTDATRAQPISNA